MTKNKHEAKREDPPTIVEKEVAKTCSCSKETGRDIKCCDHGDPDKI